ncbi:MAG: DUF1616 domain-containing protein [Promethearchaeota archaeon]
MNKVIKSIKEVLDKHFIFLLLIIALIISSAMLIIEFTSKKAERYSAMALLNENMETGPFPQNISYTDRLTLHVQIFNQEGKTTLYQVRCYIGDQETFVDPHEGTKKGTLLFNDTHVVIENGTWDKLITLDFNESNAGQKIIIFELWKYDVEEDSFHFNNIFIHLWIYIRGPST